LDDFIDLPNRARLIAEMAVRSQVDETERRNGVERFNSGAVEESRQWVAQACVELQDLAGIPGQQWIRECNDSFDALLAWLRTSLRDNKLAEAEFARLVDRFRSTASHYALAVGREIKEMEGRLHVAGDRPVEQPFGTTACAKQESETPTDLIPTREALQKFQVDRSTLLRAAKREKLKSYRPPGAASKSTHIFSEAELASMYPRR
jgi:hypothetical protein